ncbi:MAG: VOC family protein [Clostridia bacterium]|nr:VOC family protein [Clostridia bacterium]
MITGIHHIAIKCKGIENYKETVAFYRDILGVPVAREWGEGEDLSIMLDTGAGIVEIFSKGGETLTEGVLCHIAFATKDTDACIAAVRAAGYEITMEPTDVCIGDNYPAKIGFCKGPAGEIVEFFCEK